MRGAEVLLLVRVLSVIPAFAPSPFGKPLRMGDPQVSKVSKRGELTGTDVDVRSPLAPFSRARW